MILRVLNKKPETLQFQFLFDSDVFVIFAASFIFFTHLDRYRHNLTIVDIDSHDQPQACSKGEWPLRGCPAACKLHAGALL